MSELFLMTILIMMILCLFMVLTERKLLAHAQSRFGPSIMGSNGWLQIMVDLMKLMNKEFFFLPKSGSMTLPIYIIFFYMMQLFFMQNFIFGPSLYMFEKSDGLIFYHLMLVMFSNMILMMMGYLSQSKYSMMGVVRGMVHVMSLDMFITFMYMLIIFFTQSGHFHDFSMIQLNTWFLMLLSPLSFGFLMMLLVEAKSAPFDHMETESEVVAGYATEHSSIFLLIFYLAEYMHLIMSANHFSIFFLGGWNLINMSFMLPIMFYSFYDINYYLYLFY